MKPSFQNLKEHKFNQKFKEKMMHSIKLSTSKKSIASLFCFLFVILTTNAQTTKNTIKGKVIDAITKETIPYASIVIKSKENNSIITGGITKDDGNFEIKNIPSGNLIFEVQFVGFLTYSKDISITKKTTNIGVVEIKEESERLDDIEIVAERSTIEQKIDRKIINVGKDLTTSGATAADIMANVPSVDIDQDGNLSLRGNQNVRVLVDGRPTNISADQLLKQIPSTSIKKIELITNPSAKYNPEGMSGIINFVLHKSVNIGFNGNVNLGLTQGEETRFNSSLDLNYRVDKINIYGNYGNTAGDNFFNGEIFRPEENSNQVWKSKSDRTSHLFKVGLDYYLTDKTIFSFYTTQNIFDGVDSGSTDVIYFDGDLPDLTQILVNSKYNHAATYNFDIKHNFKEEGNSIELEVDYNDFDEEIDTDFDFLGGDGSFLPYLDDIENTNENVIISLDYVNTISSKTKLEFGAESRLRRTENIYDTSSTSFVNSEFDYDMDIHSFYGIISQDFKKWSYQVGARFESYEVNGRFAQEGDEDQAITDDIYTVYPSAFLRYTPNEETKKNSYQVSYSRRVDRPGVSQVNPIRSFATPRITSQGNPDLRPQFTNSVEFNYIKKIKGGSITSGVFYRFIEDEINRIGFEDPEDPTRIILSYDNYQDNTAFGFELAGNYKINKWWSANASFDLYSQQQKGIVESEYIEVDNLMYNFRISNSFKATKNLTFQLFALYRGPNENLQFEVNPFYFVNAGGRYNFLDRKATVSLNFNDIFKTQQWGFVGDRPLPQVGSFNWDSRTVYLGFSYRFGQGKNKSVKRKKRDKNEKKSGGFL